MSTGELEPLRPIIGAFFPMVTPTRSLGRQSAARAVGGIFVRLSHPTPASAALSIDLLSTSLAIEASLAMGTDVESAGRHVGVTVRAMRTGSLELEVEVGISDELRLTLDTQQKKPERLVNAALRRLRNLTLALSLSLNAGGLTSGPPDCADPLERPAWDIARQTAAVAPPGAKIKYVFECGPESFEMEWEPNPGQDPRGEVSFEPTR